MITVAIIEDNRLVREGMTDMLNELPDVKVVLASTSFDTNKLKETNPRVVLLDVGLQDKNSLRLAETVKRKSPSSLMRAWPGSFSRTPRSRILLGPSDRWPMVRRFSPLE